MRTFRYYLSERNYQILGVHGYGGGFVGSVGVERGQGEGAQMWVDFVELVEHLDAQSLFLREPAG